MHLDRQTNHSHGDMGFTLMEMMIVLALIAILSSMAMPSLRGFTASTRLKSSAHAIRDMLHFGRDIAITERTAYLVVFDLDGNRYWLASSETFAIDDPSTSLLVGSAARVSGILGVPQHPNHNVTLFRMITNHNFRSNEVDAGVDYIYFSPTGSSEDVVLYIQDAQGESMSITVEGATGRVRIQELNAQQSEALGLSGTRQIGIGY